MAQHYEMRTAGLIDHMITHKLRSCWLAFLLFCASTLPSSARGGRIDFSFMIDPWRQQAIEKLGLSSDDATSAKLGSIAFLGRRYTIYRVENQQNCKLDYCRTVMFDEKNRKIVFESRSSDRVMNVGYPFSALGYEAIEFDTNCGRVTVLLSHSARPAQYVSMANGLVDSKPLPLSPCP